jgi:hypothetical protein
MDSSPGPATKSSAQDASVLKDPVAFDEANENLLGPGGCGFLYRTIRSGDLHAKPVAALLGAQPKICS